MSSKELTNILLLVGAVGVVAVLASIEKLVPRIRSKHKPKSGSSFGSLVGNTPLVRLNKL
jgi:hypothetical protein